MKNKSPDFLALLESFFCEHLPVSVGASPNTIKSYKFAFRLFLKYMFVIKEIPADKISFKNLNYDCLSGFLNWLETERNCSASTKNQRMSALLSFSEYAQNRNFEAASVFRTSAVRVPVKKCAHKLRISFTRQEVQLLLEAPDETTRTGRRDKVLLSLMYATGARAQEICDLRVRDIEFNESGTASITLTGKGGKARRIGIPVACSKMLKQYISFRNIGSLLQRHVFSSQTHEFMTISCVEEIFKKYVSACKEKHPDKFLEASYPPHSMRHTTACHMLEAGVPIIVIKNFLGHASISTTQIYAEVSQNMADKHLKEWSKKWFSTEKAPEQSVHTKSDLPDFLMV